ncbi:MAG: tryptophan--tRNA ligase [Flexistipes sinusarabici]|uniref:Tryptophan--tRNA ligase n=1 Tax=Flexistipes sinusarabici TaxID=2352 RepID=A0A5D0MXS4_FLESI|nr:tryptophan--tRNA ligase [Flexistipes sinusarabici]TYB36994.1 MAG: tryptophan--tRNA ligase [Flexistipes sinusarabici]
MTRVLSGMRPTGKLHIGHYFGALQNWVSLQDKYECFYFIADWHALTTGYETPPDFHALRREMLLDWLTAGLDPNKSTLFIQSKNSAHAELYLLLNMITPIGWLERCPTYKEMKEELNDKDLSNIGFLSYPVLQTADIIIYDAKYVPVGKDQVPHLEISREIVRRFNYLYNADVFVEPEALLTKTPKLLGTDGRKMSKSYDNAILLSEDLKSVEKKIKQMKTDTNRKRKSDPGNPFICPVFGYHEVFSTKDEQEWVINGCKNAEIGCIDCKKVLIKHLVEFLEPLQEKRNKLDREIDNIYEYLSESQRYAEEIAAKKLEEAKKAMNL